MRSDGDHLPIWDEEAGYLDPGTGEVLPIWDEVLDALDEDAEPLHVLRFGEQVDMQGVLYRLRRWHPVPATGWMSCCASTPSASTARRRSSTSE
ncbi:hypothetical protein GCM10020216_076570 [Nonomuraea helvata]